MSIGGKGSDSVISSHRRTAIIAMLAVVGLVAVACGGNSTTSGANTSSSTGAPTTGGTIREELPEFGWTNAFDPTGEYLGYAWGLYDQLLMRGLMTYKHTDAANGGDTPVPDLATGPPTVSDDGLTYDFTLKDNVKWGPPLERNVTADDIYYAFQRINSKALVAQYGNYYCGVIVGMDCAAKDDKQPIDGIKVADATHISFTLEQPTGDFLYRLTMAATKAVPPEVGNCFTKAGDYGVDVISSGPYMILGQDDLDLSSCNTIKPISGYNVNNGMTLVRNPNYEAATDGTRGAYADGIQLKINSNVDDEFNRLQAGDLDVVEGTPPTKVLRDFQTTDQYQGWLHADQGDRTWYVTMNLLAPPFDDVHVRKAVNLALNKDGIRKQYGGTLRGDLATSVEPPTVLPQSTDINPYSDNTGQGNADAAMAEMKQSSYDTNQNGVCDDGGVCDNILFLGRSTAPWPQMNQVALASLKPILPGLVLREVDTTTGYTTLQQVKKLVPISMVPGWGKDYASPYGFDFFIFDSEGIACTAAVNYSLVGITADQATECGVKDAYDAYVAKNGAIPSVDDKMGECVAKSADQVDPCFAELDSYLMDTAIPWAPWLWATNFTSTNLGTVTHYEFDQNAGIISYVNTSVNNDLAPENVA
jgi:peptide/nickel transport system substrate-binding protein